MSQTLPNNPGQYQPSQPDSNRSYFGNEIDNSSKVKAGQQVVKNVIERVEQDQQPRWQVLRRGRTWIGPFVFALIAVSTLAIAARSFSILPGDLPFSREIQENRTPLLTDLMYAVSFIGTGIAPIIVTSLVLLLLWIGRLRVEAVFLALGLLADLLGLALKLIVGRHRPTSNLIYVAQQLSSPSFPSGHTLHYTVFYGFLAFVIAINFRNSWTRNVICGVCIGLIALVGPSRIYLGEHWLSDVLGGYLLGSLCLILLISGYLWVKGRFEITALPPWLHRITRDSTL